MHEVKRLTDAFGSHVKRWSAAADSLDRALRNLGDIENFAAALERDIHSLSTMLVQLASSPLGSVQQPETRSPTAGGRGGAA